MTAFLWTNFVLGVIAVLCRVLILGAGKTTETTPRTHAGSLLVSLGFLVWTGVLLFGGAS